MPIHTETKTSVVSRDGTQIAYWTSGGGPPIVLVHGAPAGHTRWRPSAPVSGANVTVHAIDRRGRGASGDAPEYRPERSTKTLRPWWMPWRRRPANRWTSTGIRTAAPA
jgi:pimeloyl-ACP methyl ester carboxylesterase